MNHALRKTTFFLVLPFFVLYSFYLTSFRPDDVFIYYRYAHNLASGDGIVFNPSEKVEGVTSLLWTLLLALIIKVGARLETAAPLLSLACGLIVLSRLPILSAKLQGRSEVLTQDLCPVVWVASSHPFAFWSYSGMETVLFALLLLLIIETVLEGSTNNLYLCGLLTSIATIVRPESLSAIPALFAYVSYRYSRDWKAIGVWLGTVCVLIGAIFLFRFLYFGELLPNTYYAKRGISLYQLLFNGAAYCLQFLTSFFSLTPSDYVNFVLAILMLAILFHQSSRDPRLMFLTAVTVSLFAAVIYDGGDWMVLSRLLVPMIPLLALGFCTASLPYVGQRVTLVLMIALVSANLRGGFLERTSAVGQLNPINFTNPDYGPFISFLKKHAEPYDVVALMDIGEIGYKTMLPIIDISGLTEPKIAHAPGGFLGKIYPPEWVLDCKPRWIALRKDWDDIDARFFESERFQRDYVQVLEVQERTPMTLYELTHRESTVGGNGAVPCALKHQGA